MERIAAQLTLGLTLVLAASGCPTTARNAPHIGESALAEIEAKLAQSPLQYRTFTESQHFNPTGLYVHNDVLWIVSSEHPQQNGFKLDTMAGVPSRTGPQRTLRCRTNNESAVCVGEREPGGIRSFGTPVETRLPPTVGYRDLAFVDDQLVVLDGVTSELVTASTGESLALPPGAKAIGPVGKDHLWVSLSLPPYLASVSPSSSVRLVERRAPIRDAAFDGDRLLWVVGPVNQRMRREDGPLTNAYSEAVALDAESFRAGEYRIMARHDFRMFGLADGTAIVAKPGEIAVAAMGSDAVLTYSGSSGRVQGDCLTPSAMTFTRKGLAIACRLADSVLLPKTVTVLRNTRRDSLVDHGERLFYSAALWRRAKHDLVTCNTCHWNGGSDHRISPGFMERRSEVTRPLGGLSAVTPIFSTGGTNHVSRAIEGLIRSLDPRLWFDVKGNWWDYPVELQTKHGTVTLSPKEVREALLRFVMQLRPEPPARRRVGEPLSSRALAGQAHFERDCAGCHQPRRTLHKPSAVPNIAAALVDAPLVFGTPGFAPTNAGPPVTPNGNRMTPLMNLSRGGPWFTSGSAPTLEAVLRRFDPNGPVAHGQEPRASYSEQTVEELLAFLRSI
ncbi:MAG: hypothetical protein ACI9OJ_001042 [Myxococcota bacterium]|jgi:hypothetical protein